MSALRRRSYLLYMLSRWHDRPHKPCSICWLVIFFHMQSFQVEGPQDREISLFLRIKIGRFLRELLKALPKTIGKRNDLRTVALWRCLLFILAPSLNRTLSNQAMTMRLLCLTMSARAKLRCRRRLGCFLSTPFICFATLSDIVRKKTIKYTTMAYLGKALFLAGFGSQ